MRAKPPIAETAEYTPDFQRIVVRFDQNIQIANCNETFSPETEKHLGKGFTCAASGDALHVTLGDESELTETITIVSGNNIHRSLIAGNELSPSAAATTLPLSKEKVDPCTRKEKQMKHALSVSGEDTDAESLTTEHGLR